MLDFFAKKVGLYNKRQCRTKLTYYGTVDDDGVVHPKKQKLVKAEVKEDPTMGDGSLSLVSEKNIGMTRVLSRISEEIGLSEALKESFPKTWRSILSLAMYHVGAESNAAYLFEEWAEETETPIGKSVLTSRMISELYKGMDNARRLDFLHNWRNKASTGGACFHDITSISSYSLKSDVVEYGYNRDKEDLPRINLGMVSDSGNRLPLYYKIHDGSITDVSTLKNVLKEGYAFNMKNLTFVMDKGFFSKGNIEAMYSFDCHFIVSMSFTANAAFEAVDRVRDTIRHPRNVVCTTNGEYLYASSFETCWGGRGPREEVQDPCLHKAPQRHRYQKRQSGLEARRLPERAQQRRMEQCTCPSLCKVLRGDRRLRRLEVLHLQ